MSAGVEDWPRTIQLLYSQAWLCNHSTGLGKFIFFLVFALSRDHSSRNFVMLTIHSSSAFEHSFHLFPCHSVPTILLDKLTITLKGTSFLPTTLVYFISVWLLLSHLTPFFLVLIMEQRNHTVSFQGKIFHQGLTQTNVMHGTSDQDS